MDESEGVGYRRCEILPVTYQSFPRLSDTQMILLQHARHTKSKIIIPFYVLKYWRDGFSTKPGKSKPRVILSWKRVEVAEHDRTNRWSQSSYERGHVAIFKSTSQLPLTPLFR